MTMLNTILIWINLQILICSTALLPTYKEDGCECFILNTYTDCSNEKIKNCINFPRNISLQTNTLRIKETHIKTIRYGDFENLNKLKTLVFDGNHDLVRFETNVFENMTNLNRIDFIYNSKLKTLSASIFTGLRNLNTINIHKNHFRNIDAMFKALSPINLPKLKFLVLKEENFRMIREHTFDAMEGSVLEDLTIEMCGIEKIHPKTFKPLRKLKKLQIGQNQYTIETLNNLLNETIHMGINLDMVNLHSVGFWNALSSDLMEIIANSNISELILAGNHFSMLHKRFFPIPMPNLKRLDLTGVSLRYIPDYIFCNLQNLTDLILDLNELTNFPIGANLQQLKNLGISKNTDAYGWQFNLHESQFHKMTQLKLLDLSFTTISVLKNQSFGTIITLHDLNMKNCSIIYIEKFALAGLKNLRVLNLENNHLFKLSPEIRLTSKFEIIPSNLETLLLGSNGITGLEKFSKYAFRNLKHLRHLSLDSNKIQSISSNHFASLENLETLDISNNCLKSWNSRVFGNITLKAFYGRNNRLSLLSVAMLEDFQNIETLDLCQNPLICDCEMVKYSAKIRKALGLSSKQNVEYCVQPVNITLNDFFDNVEFYSSKLNCNGSINIKLLIVAASFFALLIILTILGYLYRWKIRYFLFLAKHNLTQKRLSRLVSKSVHTNYQYDAFISYCSHDQDFILKLIENLENAQPYYKLCAYERDFEIGAVISETVLDKLTKSRKTVLVVSNAYAQSYWCTWESHIAQFHKILTENVETGGVDDGIIIIKLGSINDAHLTPTLKNLLATRICLRWDERGIRQQVFWMRLREFLGDP